MVSTVTCKNGLREKLRSGRNTVGLSLMLDSAQIAEEFAMSGADYLYIDQQHGLADTRGLLEMLRAAEKGDTSVLVRVASNSDSAIAHALDAGAHGVIVPMVEDRLGAEAAAQSSRYAPEGRRSWGPIRASHGLGTDPRIVNEEVLCFVMVETSEGLANIDDIVSVPGIDGVYIGPADLSVSLGGPPLGFEQIHDESTLEAVHQIKKACALHNRSVAITGDARARHADGFNMVTVSSDISIIRGYLSDHTGFFNGEGDVVK